MELYLTALKGLIAQSGLVGLTTGNLIMLVVALVLLYLAIVKGFEPLLLMPIAFSADSVSQSLGDGIGERQVGYQEQNYFSYVFKKKFGVSPTKFRGSRS